MNLSTLIVSLILVGIIGLAIRSLVTKKGACSCGCSGCSQKVSCHKNGEV